MDLTIGGLTLLGVLLSIGLTVGFGVGGPWWLKIAAGLATTAGLAALVKLATSRGRGPLASVAQWVITTNDGPGSREPDSENEPRGRTG